MSAKMNVLVFVAALLAAAGASVIASPSAKIIQGPSSSSTIIGPDGSSISSVSPGGAIVAEDHPGFEAYAAPIVAAPSFAYRSPLIASYSAYPAYSGYVAHPGYAAYAAPVHYGNAIVAEKSYDTVIAGPSGTITTSKTQASPAVVGHYSLPAAYTYY